MKTHSDIIDHIGGPTKVSAGLNGRVGATAVVGWRHRGIPGKYWVDIAELAGISPQAVRDAAPVTGEAA
jgi:hypothetical protein